MFSAMATKLIAVSILSSSLGLVSAQDSAWAYQCSKCECSPEYTLPIATPSQSASSACRYIGSGIQYIGVNEDAYINSCTIYSGFGCGSSSIQSIGVSGNNNFGCTKITDQGDISVQCVSAIPQGGD